MAESKYCAGCQRGDENNIGEAWCCDCAELVCKTCSGFHKKLSPPHKVVPIEKISSISSALVTLSKNCLIHSEQKIVLFCSQHDQVICDSCFADSHQNCKPVMSIEKAAKDAQQGIAVTNLERRIDNLTCALEKVVNTFSMQLLSLNDRAKDFKKKVGDIRKNIVSYMDKLEADFNEEIDRKYKECNDTLLKDQSDIQGRYDRLSVWKRDIESLRQHTTNIQLFHVIKYLDAKVHGEETEFRQFSTNTTLPILNCTLAEPMSKILDILPSFGDLSVDNNSITSSLDLNIDQQGQAFVRSEVPSKKPSLVTSFQTSVLGDDVDIYRCCFVPDNKLLLCGKDKLYVCDHDGSNTKTIGLDYDPNDVTLYDRNTALISVEDESIQIIDMETMKPGKPIEVWSYCSAITSLNGKIWVKSDYRTLIMIDIKGKVQKKITTSFDILHICLTKNGDIYCTDDDSDDVYVVTFDGEERVVYSSPDLNESCGITVDNHGGVYIAGFDSHNIHRISSDGQQSNIILTEEDGIEHPGGLSFNHQTKELMVVNNIGSCINIYKVS